MKIALTSVIVYDPVEAYMFYTKILGFTKKLYIPEMNLAIVTSPEEPNGTGLLLEPNDNLVGKSFQESLYRLGLPIIVFGTPDIAQEYDRLKKLRVVFRGEPVKTEWGTQVLFEDTCGNLIQLHQV